MSDELEPVEVAAPPKKPGKLKWIIIGVVACVVIGGGMGGALLFMGGDKDRQDAKAEGGHEAAGETAEAEHPPMPTVYVPLEPAFVVNYQTADSSGFLQVAMEASTTDPQAVELIKQHNPVIRNNLLMLLGSAPVEELKTREGKDKLRGAARDEINKVLAGQGQKKGVDEVLFTSFVLQ